MSNEVVGYMYNADLWHEDCIIQTHGDLELWAERLGIDPNDEHSYDSDEYPKVILSQSESGDVPDSCCVCHGLLDTSWSGDTVEYAVSSLENYVIARVTGLAIKQNMEVLDAWAERLSSCIVDDHDKWMIDLYNVTREYDDNIG